MHRRPTIGVLAGWQVYAGATPISYLESVLRGIQSAAHDLGCNLLVACGVGRAVGPVTPAWPIPSPDADFVPVGPWNTDGLLVLRPLLSEARARDVRRFVAGGHPVVFIGAGEGGPAVDSDEKGSIHRAVAHLVEHGHRRIAFVAGRAGDEGNTVRRLAAYRAAMRAHGLACDELVAHCPHPLDDGREAVEQLLSERKAFTALVALNDRMAIGAMRALERAGRRIPDDVAVIGFDDRPEALAQSPPLASVRFPMAEIGYRALGLLLDVVEGRAGSSDVIRVPTRLIVRQSCGCPPRATPATGGKGPRAGPDSPDAMVEALAGELKHVKPDEVRFLGERLREAFAASLRRADPAVFDSALEDVLRHVEKAGDDAHPWQAAISILHEETPSILETCRSRACELADDLLHRARVAISESTRRQHARHLVQEADIADRLSWMTSHLLETLDEDRVFEVLSDYLPQVGINCAHVALFESEVDDPVAWSNLRSIPGQGATARFPTREFPPRGLAPADERFSLMLLPLAVQEERGFVAFCTGDLRPCAVIVRQLAAALRSVRLYQQAVEGRQLAEKGEQLAREASLLKSRLLSTVSHELRTPLGLVVGLSETLLHEQQDETPLPETHREELERIHAGARHLDSLMRDVLDLARSEAGQLQLACERLDLAEVLQPVAVVGERMARDKDLAWRAAIPDDLPPVWGDRTRLRQVALNLVSNAVKFTEKGEVALRVEAREIANGESQIAGDKSQISNLK
jgi:DNA-binding LacI/PurR family transcriptional regulator